MRTTPLASAILTFLLALPAAPAIAAKGDCGQPSTTGTSPKAADALYILKKAVGLVACDLCVCDVNNDTKVTASDALKVLKKAVGIPQVLTCPACVPSLTGTVTVPTSPRLQAGDASLLAGWSAASGATVELVNLDTKGNVVLPVVASAVTDSSGNYRISPRPTPGSQVMVRTTIGGETMRAFVVGPTANLNPAQEYLASTTIAAIQGSAPATLANLSIGEIADYSLWLAQAPIDLTSFSTVATAVAGIDSKTGGKLGAELRDFALGNGPTVPLSGSFHLLQVGARYANSSTPASQGISGAVQGQVQHFGTMSTMVVASDGSVPDAATGGITQTLAEDHVTTKNGLDPDLSGNAAVSYTGASTTGTLGSGVTVRASDHGSLILRHNDDTVLASTGMFASGSGAGMAATAWASPTGHYATAGANFLLRAGSGFTNSSLSGTYSFVILSQEVATDDSQPSTVQRKWGGSVQTGAMSFSGGNVSFPSPGTISGDEVLVQKAAPPAGDPPAGPNVYLNTSSLSDSAPSGLKYNLSATGELSLLSGTKTVGSGAVSADRNMFVVLLPDESGTASNVWASAGLLVGVKRGSGMNNASGNGHYNVIELTLNPSESLQVGSPDNTRDLANVMVSMRTSHSSFDLNGAGTVSLNGGFSVQPYQNYQQETMRHVSGAPTVYAPVYTAGASSDPNNPDAPSFPFQIGSNGTVSIAGGQLTGFLSADGNVFLLPQFSADQNQGWGEATLLIGMRAP